MSPFVSRRARGISRAWIIVTMLVFLTIELLLGDAVGTLVKRHPGHVFHMKVEVLVMLASYFLGGIVVGFVSGGSRLDEPIIAAFLAVLVTFLLAAFTPLRFFRFSLGRILLGGLVAAGVAVVGVDLGARAAGRIRRTSPS